MHATIFKKKLNPAFSIHLNTITKDRNIKRYVFKNNSVMEKLTLVFLPLPHVYYREDSLFVRVANAIPSHPRPFESHELCVHKRSVVPIVLKDPFNFIIIL